MQKQIFLELRKYRKYFSVYSLLYLLLLFLIFVPSLGNYNSGEGISFPVGSYYSSSSGFNDTLRHYQQILDSVKYANDRYFKLRNGVEDVERPLFLSKASVTYYKPFTSGYRSEIIEDERRFFVVLYPYTIDPNCHIVSAKDTNVLVTSIWSYAKISDPENPVYIKDDSTEKLIDIRFSDKNVLVPITSSQNTIITYTRDVVSLALLIWFLAAFLFMPVSILINISKGHAFEKQNIKYLNVIGYTCLGIPLFTVLQQVALRVIFYKSIIPQLHFRYFSFYEDYHYLILAGVAVLIIAKAFKKGNMLQQEQDLTV